MHHFNSVAKTLRHLHVPGRPLVLANVYDALSAEAVAALPSCHALATASYAVARAAGTQDDDMTQEINLAASGAIAKVAAKHQKPLTVDFQDGYGEGLEEGIATLVNQGVSGINLEDVNKDTQKFYPIEEAVSRIKRVPAAAKQEGVPDFVVNARCDTLVHGGELQEVLQRGKSYLDAGATTVFVWGGSARGVRTAEVVEMVKAFKGRLNVSMVMAPGKLTVPELEDIGVARISVGPQIQFMAMDHYAKQAESILTLAK